MTQIKACDPVYRSFKVVYRSADPKRTLLGGVGCSESSHYESREDAEARLQGIIDVHAKLDTPLEVIGEVQGSMHKPEIFADGSCIGCTWGKAAEIAQAR